jgi:hypothetical protein
VHMKVSVPVCGRIISPAVHRVLRWMIEILFWRHRNTA